MKLKIMVLAIFLVTLPVLWAEQPSEPILGEPAPDFTLTDLDGNQVKLSSFVDKFVVLEWTNYDCPFVKKHYETSNMQALQNKYIKDGVIWLVINSSAPGKQGNYSINDWKRLAAERQSFPTAILPDESGKAGKLYMAQTTPHMFVIDKNGELVYMGAIDDDPSYAKEGVKTATNYVDKALKEAMEGKPVSTPISRPYGCSVKY
jgi:peroxiredoxin